MKKVLFTIFAVLFMMPVRSSATTCVPQPDKKSPQTENALKTTNNQWLYCGGTTETNCDYGTWVLGFDNRIYECSDNNKWSVAKITTDCRPHEGNILYHDGRTFRGAPYYSYILNNETEQIIGFKYFDDDDKIKIERACYVPQSECDSSKESVAGVCKTLETMPVWGQLDNETPATMYAAASGSKTSSTQYVSTTNQPVLPTTPASGDTLDLSECENSGGTHNTGDTKCTCTGVLEETVQTYNGKKYSICKCVTGYKRENGKYKDKCVDAGETTTEKVLDTAKMAQNKYDQARKREQSLGNRALTAGTTAATGLGAMATASALAEQNADRDAEVAMQEYLGTMKCEYGNGQQQNIGNEEIILPGGNELLEYYTEYKTLADSVKQTKSALGLRAGIESETLYDRAQSNLYQYKIAEIKNSTTPSVSRALMNPDGDDAAAWNAQKAETKSNLTTGIIATAGGVAAGVAGNYLINRKYKNQELQDEFKEITRRLENKHPQIFEPVTVETKPVQIPSLTEQEPEQAPITPEVFAAMTEQLSEQTFKKGELELSNGGQDALNGLASEVISLLKQPQYAKAQLEINIEAHTDKLGLTQDTKNRLNVKNNQELSQKRADTIMDYLIGEFNKDTNVSSRVQKGIAKGKGDSECTNKGDQPSCRKLIVQIIDTTDYNAE